MIARPVTVSATDATLPRPGARAVVARHGCDREREHPEGHRPQVEALHGEVRGPSREGGAHDRQEDHRGRPGEHRRPAAGEHRHHHHDDHGGVERSLAAQHREAPGLRRYAVHTVFAFTNSRMPNLPSSRP